MIDIELQTWARAALTSLGFFWKSAWAFVLGYAVSAMIQTFVPRDRLTPYLGGGGPRSIALATALGGASSSCSFAALSTARALLLKGASFIAAVAFMFASTNLVIELGILIVLFLGWGYLAAEVAGGLTLIVVSSLLIRLTCPEKWLEQARERVEEETTQPDGDFDWRERLRQREAWRAVGNRFVEEWGMVWEEILIGFTIAGITATLVPADLWQALFLAGDSFSDLPAWLIALENALLAPLVAAATFIGSMGNIPLATVLSANGVLFAGVMAFIYSDLMIPPLVMINSRYYGWRIGLYIATIMYVSIVLTTLLVQLLFSALHWVPESSRSIDEVVRFGLDYTFNLNLALGLVALWLITLRNAHRRGSKSSSEDDEGDSDRPGAKRLFAWLAALSLGSGLLIAVLARLGGLNL